MPIFVNLRKIDQYGLFRVQEPRTRGKMLLKIPGREFFGRADVIIYQNHKMISRRRTPDRRRSGKPMQAGLYNKEARND